MRKELKNKLLGVLFGMLIAVLAYIYQDNKIYNLNARVRESNHKYEDVVKTISKKDSVIAVLSIERAIAKGYRSSVTERLDSNIKAIDSLTDINVTNVDIEEALLWLEQQ